MVFSSPIFLLLFLPTCLGLYFVAPKAMRNAVLLALSFVFYVWGGGWFIVILLGSALIDLLVGKRIAGLDSVVHRQHRRALLAVSVCSNLLILYWFKYQGVLGPQFNRVTNRVAGIELLPAWNYAVPLGLSFLTFQSISYVVDVYRGEFEDLPKPTEYFLFGFLFPHLLAGPIVRYSDIRSELRQRQHTASRVALGMSRFSFGLGKKVLLADRIGPTVDAVFGGEPTLLGAPGAWFGGLLAFVHVYLDASAYSDMAIGIGLILGFTFPENFRRPMSARSVTDLYRRFHITVITFIRDYIYVPLGGRRRSPLRNAFNVIVVMMVSGLWHGAGVHFAVWGVAFGCWFLLERRLGIDEVGDSGSRWARPRFLVAISFFMAVFRCGGLHAAARYVMAMITPTWGDPGAIFSGTSPGTWLLIGLATATVLLPPTRTVGVYLTETSGRRADVARIATVAVVLPISILVVVSTTFQPFVYFKW